MNVDSEKLTSVTFRITEDELIKFDRIARKKQTSRASLLRGYIIETNRKSGNLV